MRLPEYLSRISPVGETLDAITAGELALDQNITAENGRLSVASADRDGLSLWEADYGIEDASGLPLDVRRAKIRTAMSDAAAKVKAGDLKVKSYYDFADEAEYNAFVEAAK